MIFIVFDSHKINILFFQMSPLTLRVSYGVHFFLSQVWFNIQWTPDEQPLLSLQWEWHQFLNLLLFSFLLP